MQLDLGWLVGSTEVTDVIEGGDFKSLNSTLYSSLVASTVHNIPSKPWLTRHLCKWKLDSVRCTPQVYIPHQLAKRYYSRVRIVALVASRWRNSPSWSSPSNQQLWNLSHDSTIHLQDWGTRNGLSKSSPLHNRKKHDCDIQYNIQLCTICLATI